FLQAYPMPVAVTALTAKRWQRWASAHRLSDARTHELWGNPPATATAGAGPCGPGQGPADADPGGGTDRGRGGRWPGSRGDRRLFRRLAGGAVDPTAPDRWPRRHGTDALGPSGGRPAAVGVVAAPPRACWHRARDDPERPAAGRSVPRRL